MCIFVFAELYVPKPIFRFSDQSTKDCRVHDRYEVELVSRHRFRPLLSVDDKLVLMQLEVETGFGGGVPVVHLTLI